MTLKSHFASHYPSKRYGREGLKTSISLGNICGLPLCKRGLNSVQCLHFLMFSKFLIYMQAKTGGKHKETFRKFLNRNI